MSPLNRPKNSVYRLLLGVSVLLAGSAAHAQNFTSFIDPANPTFTQLLGINSSDTIVGYGNMTIFNGLTLTHGVLTRLNVSGADGGTQVTGISNGGTAVGFSITGGVTSGFAHTGATFTPVSDPGFAFTQLLGISSNGSTAAGYWSHDVTSLTGQLAGFVTGGPGFASPSFTGINGLLPLNDNSQATGVNNAGEVVGFFQEGPNSSPLFTAFTDIGGSITPFQFPGSSSTQALGVNDLGEIVGDYILGGEMFGFLDNHGVFTQINPPGATSSTANGINDKGIIVGFYMNGAGNTIGFATAPEPSTWAMMALGFAGLGFAGYRKARREGAALA